MPGVGDVPGWIPIPPRAGRAHHGHMDDSAPTPRRSGRPLRRATDDRLLGGVAAGVARQLDLDVATVRVATVALCLLAGVGVPLYLAGWLLVPEEGTDTSLAEELVGGHRS